MKGLINTEWYYAFAGNGRVLCIDIIIEEESAMKRTMQVVITTVIAGTALLASMPAQSFWGPFNRLTHGGWGGPWGGYPYYGGYYPYYGGYYPHYGGYPYYGGWGYPAYGYPYVTAPVVTAPAAAPAATE